MKVVIDDKIPFIKGVLEPYADVEYCGGKNISPEQLLTADAMIIRTRTICNEALLANSKVKFIATATIGYDHIDVDYLAKKNIKWTNAPGCNSNSVAQYICGSIGEIFEDAKGKTLGVIGVGHVGTKVANVGRHLGMNVLLNDPPRSHVEKGENFIELDELLRQSDVVTVHVPLIVSGEYKTLNLANKEFFSKMKTNSYFINSSRGEVVCEDALKKYLLDKKINSILDVWRNEPNIDEELLKLCLFGTPHIAGYSADGKANGTTMSIRSLANFFGIETLKNFSVSMPQVENNFEEISNKAFKLSGAYTPKEDSNKLKANLEKFEYFRGNYPQRREVTLF